jgi:hypothetical protein
MRDCVTICTLRTWEGKGRDSLLFPVSLPIGLAVELPLYMAHVYAHVCSFKWYKD